MKALARHILILLIVLLSSACGDAVRPPRIDLMALPSYDLPGETVKERLTAGLEPAPTASADFEEEVPLTLREVVVSVLLNNRDIRVAYHAPVQAKAGILEAQSPYDPEAFGEWQYNRNSNPDDSGSKPTNRRYDNNTERAGLRQLTPTGATVTAYREWTSGAEWETNDPKTHGRGRAYVMQMTQPLLNGFGNREVSANIAISRVQYDRSEEELRRVMIKATADAMDVYWNVALAREEVRIYEETLGMAERLLARERNRLGEGISTDLDVNRAKEAVATRTVNLINAKEQEVMYQERLKLLLNKQEIPVGSKIKVKAVDAFETPLLRTDLDRSIEAALANRPEIRQADLAVKAGEIREDYAKHDRLPKLDLIGSIRDNGHNSDAYVPGYDTDSRGRDWSVGVLFTMPLGNMKARAGLERASSERRQAMDEMMNVRDIVVAEIKTSVKGLELIIQEIPQTERAVEASRRVVEGEWARFELNQVGNRDLLQAQDLLAVSERNRVQSLIRYNNAIIDLLAAEGTLLDHLGVVMQQAGDIKVSSPD